MNLNSSPRRTARTGRLCLFLSLILAVSVLVGAASAVSFTVETPGGELTAGVPVTLPVYITDAADVAGINLYITEDSHGTMTIKPASATLDGLTINPATNLVLLNPVDPTAAPLDGKVKLCEIEVTPAAGENVLISFDVREVLNSANDYVMSEKQISQTIAVTDGKTVNTASSSTSAKQQEDDSINWVYDPSKGIYADDPVAFSELTGSNAGSKPTTEPTAATTAKATKTKKSPGFLPLTLVAALGVAGILIARVHRGGR